MDKESVRRVFREADAVVSNAKAQLAWVALQLLDVAFTRFGEPVESCKDAHGGVSVNAAEFSPRRDGEDDLLHAGCRQRFRSSAERPNSATISSWGMPSPGCCAIQALEAETA